MKHSSSSSCSTSGRQLKRETQLGRQEYILCLFSEYGSRWPPAGTGNCSWSSETGYSQGTRKAFSSNVTPPPTQMLHTLGSSCPADGSVPAALGENKVPSFCCLISCCQPHLWESSWGAVYVLQGVLHNYGWDLEDTFPKPDTHNSTEKITQVIKKKKNQTKQPNKKGSAMLTAVCHEDIIYFFILMIFSFKRHWRGILVMAIFRQCKVWSRIWIQEESWMQALILISICSSIWIR